MRFFAVIDTNVIVSALLSAKKEKESNPMQVMTYVFLGKVRPVFNEEILEEYRDVLHRKKFGFDPTLVDKVVSEIRRIGICSENMEVDDVFPDPDDALITFTDNILITKVQITRISRITEHKWNHDISQNLFKFV